MATNVFKKHWHISTLELEDTVSEHNWCTTTMLTDVIPCLKLFGTFQYQTRKSFYWVIWLSKIRCLISIALWKPKGNYCNAERTEWYEPLAISPMLINLLLMRLSALRMYLNSMNGYWTACCPRLFVHIRRWCNAKPSCFRDLYSYKVQRPIL